jgi:hypothetical protein
MELTWSAEQMSMAQRIVMERFAVNSVAGHLSPHSTVDDRETTVNRNRFDFTQSIVIDREVLDLFEPFSFCRFSKAQVDEFAEAQGEEAAQTKVVTTLTRAASNLARWHDVLFFRGFSEGQPLERRHLISLPDPLFSPGLEHRPLHDGVGRFGLPMLQARSAESGALLQQCPRNGGRIDPPGELALLEHPHHLEALDVGIGRLHRLEATSAG